ncbi:hypothetical protein ACQKWADRAFT_230676 [Trichoderma austrokoningii]
MPNQAAASRYKRPYHPPVNYKNAALRSEARAKSSGAPYAYQQLKKFNDLHALKNPDWRTRPSDNSSSAVDDGEHDVAEAAGAGKQRMGTNTSPPTTTASAFQGKRETELQNTASSSKSGATARSTLRYTQNDIFAISSGMEPKIIKALDEERPVQYKVLKQLTLSSAKEYPLHLFEVAPVGGIGYATKPIVNIRPLRGDLGQQRKQGVAGNSQDEQLTAALRAADKTPRKVRAHVYQAHGPPRAMSNELQARKGLFAETHETYASQSTKAHVHGNERQISKSDPLPNAPERDEAFQRFLQKLRHKSKASLSKKTQKRTRTDSGYEDPLKESASQRNAPSEQQPNNGHARRTENHGQKEGSSSSSSSSSSVDSGAFANGPARFKNFNPRAREFLSFAIRRDSGVEAPDPEPCQPFVAPFANQDGQTNVTPLVELAALTGTSSAQPPPPYTVVPFTAANGAVTDPMALNNLMARLIPVTADHFRGPLQTPTMPLQPLSLPNPAMLQPLSVLHPLAGNILGYPAPPLVNTTLPLTNGVVNPFLNMPPSSQMPLMGGAPPPPPPPLSQPHPVPKPRRPDPRDQQAYEAWIEWRKTYQPGYAQECRIRQQRRAQRSSDKRRVPGRVAVGQRN